MSDIEISDHGLVRVLSINRPECRNALAVTTVEELRVAIEDACQDSDVGALVLTGSGGHFSAGGDAQVILGIIGDDADDAPVRAMRSFNRLVQAIWDSELPVVAAVSGVAYGGAFNLALSCVSARFSCNAVSCPMSVARICCRGLWASTRRRNSCCSRVRSMHTRRVNWVWSAPYCRTRAPCSRMPLQSVLSSPSVLALPCR